MTILLQILLFLTSVFLVLLVLIQRGRGGGLAGAFGGLGGQSAFGTKAGDLFTRITIGVAAFWIILCAASVKLLNDPGSSLLNPTLGGAASTALPEGPAAGTSAAETVPAEGTGTEGKAEAPAAESTSAPAASAEPAAETPASAAPAEAPAAEPAPEKSN